MPDNKSEGQVSAEKSQRNKLLLFGFVILVISLAIGLPLAIGLSTRSSSDDDAPSTSLSAGSPNAAPITSPASGGGSGGIINFPTLRPTFSSPSFAAPVNSGPMQCLPENFAIKALTSGICSGLHREELYLRELRSISGENLILSPATPQGKAYAFLVNYDPFFQGSCSVTGLRERFVLMTLYFATNGENWMHRIGWCGGTQHCSWSGISCNSSGSITAIDIGTYKRDLRMKPVGADYRIVSIQ